MVFGLFDVFVNNVGINVFVDLLMMIDDDWWCCFVVDFDGVWYGCCVVLEGMVECGCGSIVNIVLMYVFRIILGCFLYLVVKYGVFGLMCVFGIEYVVCNVCVNVIVLGYIEM